MGWKSILWITQIYCLTFYFIYIHWDNGQNMSSPSWFWYILSVYPRLFMSTAMMIDKLDHISYIVHYKKENIGIGRNVQIGFAVLSLITFLIVIILYTVFDGLYRKNQNEINGHYPLSFYAEMIQSIEIPLLFAAIIWYLLSNVCIQDKKSYNLFSNLQKKLNVLINDKSDDVIC